MLELKNIKKSFDGITILNDISISIGDAEIVSILGSSGSGKTTLLNLILGITHPDSGTILFNGEDITKKPMELRDFNIVFQDYALFPNLNAYKNITYGLRNFPDRSTKEEVDSVLRNPIINHETAIRLSEFVYGKNGIVSNSIDYMTALLTLDRIVTCKNKTQKIKLFV